MDAEFPLRNEGPYSHTGLPSPECQSWEEDSPQNLMAKPVGTLAVWVRWKEIENPDVPSKGQHTD